MAFLGPSLRRKKVIDRPARRVAVAAIASIAVNAFIVLVLAAAGAFDLPKPSRKEKVELTQLSAKQWEQNRALGKMPVVAPLPRLAQEPVVPPPEPTVKKEEKPKGQVVDTGPSNDLRPDDARYLSERDNRVKKETRSRFQGADNFKNRAPAPIVSQPERKSAGERGKDQESKEAREGQRGTNEKGGKGEREARPAPKDDRLALLDPDLPRTRPDRAPAGTEGGEGIGVPGSPGEPQQETRKSGDPRLQPSFEDMSRITAGPSLDALDKDLEQGDVTSLNTRAYRFATFWNRFKQDVADHWYPGVRYAMEARDPSGTTFGRSDRVTGLRIVLDRSGAVKEIEVVSPSGLDFLDRVAVKSIRDAAPFYNIPPGLMDADGQLSFEFGFLVGGNRGVPVRPHWTPAQ
jgi:TonB family protein